MAVTQLEAREKIIEDLGTAIERISIAVACLSAAYEQLTVGPADRLESELYMPVQRALGRAKRTQSQFAERFGLTTAAVEGVEAGRPSQGAKAFVERAVVAAANADRAIADLQDTPYPIESGDAELRSGLSEVRELLARVPAAAREFLRTLGR